MVRIGSESAVVQRPSVRFEDLENLVARFQNGAEQFSEAAATGLIEHLEETGADTPEVISALANIIPPFQLSAGAMAVLRRAAVSWGEGSVNDVLTSAEIHPADLWRANDVLDTVRDVVDLWDGENDADCLGNLISTAIWSKELLGGGTGPGRAILREPRFGLRTRVEGRRPGDARAAWQAHAD